MYTRTQFVKACHTHMYVYLLWLLQNLVSNKELGTGFVSLQRKCFSFRNGSQLSEIEQFSNLINNYVVHEIRNT